MQNSAPFSIDNYLERLRNSRASTEAPHRRPLPLPHISEAIRDNYREIVERSREAWIQDEKISEAIDKASRWLQDQQAPCFLILSGPPGTGKTTLLHAIHSALKEREARSIPDFFTALQIARFAESETSKYYAICEDLSFVAIDDIGTESARLNMYGTERAPIKNLLEERYTRRLRTIITTNLGPREIRERYGDRIADRFKEAAIVPFTGESYRGR